VSAAARAPSGERGLPVAVALLGTYTLFCLVVFVYGESPRAMVAELLAGTWGSAYGAGQVLLKATPLLVAGVAVDVALRAGLFNVGAEGQIAVASLAAATVGARLPPGTPRPLALLAVVGAALVVGALWAAPPALLRARAGVHEVLTTVVQNRVADSLLSLALASGLALPGTTRTRDIVPAAALPRLDALAPALRGSSASVAFLLAVAAAALADLGFRRTRLRELWLVGQNPAACAAVGVPVKLRIAQALCLSGAIAGLTSTATVLGYKGYFELGLGAGAGFGGIAVAILGRGHALGLVGAALFFGTLEQGGLAVNAHVPREIMTVLEGVAIVLVAVADRVIVAPRSSTSSGRA
jgi:simple sugar transport system permease protein